MPVWSGWGCPLKNIIMRVLEVLGVDRSYLASRWGLAWARGVAAEMLCAYAGLTQAAAARDLGMGTGASVSIRLSHEHDQHAWVPLDEFAERKLSDAVRDFMLDYARRTGPQRKGDHNAG